MKLPSPKQLGLPPKYTKWRDAQVEGIEFVRRSRKRVRALAASTGSGKTSLALGLAKLKLLDDPDARILILTETKGLQKVYAEEGKQMQPVGLVANISGALNYDCPALEPGGRYDYLLASRGRAKVDVAPCSAGLPCKLRDRGCTYYGSDGALEAARQASIVITNYANWLSAADAAEREEKFGEFDLIICDEGHGVADVMCSALSVELDLRDVAHIKRANASQGFDEWRRWCASILPVVEDELEGLQQEIKLAKQSGRVPGRLLDEFRRTQRIVRALSRVALARGEWVTVVTGSKVAFKPVWPDQYLESHLLRHIREVVIMSATLVPEDLRSIGLRDADFDFLEIASSFPVERRPVYLLPCARMRWNMSDEEEQKNINGIDAILRCRPDWRFIIHSVSYSRALKIIERSKQSARMTAHRNFERESVVEWFFERSPRDAVIVTPAMHTGYDAADDRCRAQIIAKIPFPDTRDPVVKARVAKNKKYLYYAAAKYITQAIGRIFRHMDDFGETWITDSNALWFFEQALEFFSQSVLVAVKKVSGIGKAPKL